MTDGPNDPITEDSNQGGASPEGSPSPEPSKPDWREQLRALGGKLQQKEWARNFLGRVQSFEPMQAAEWASHAFQRQGSESAGAYGKALTIGLCAWFLADLLAILAGRYVPEPPMSRLMRTASVARRAHPIEDYNIIFTRNLFNSEGKIPGEDSAPGGPVDQGGAPVRTSLPFTLVGTLILQDELRSIATIEDKSASMVYPVRVEDEIPSKARIVKIEPRKVIFVNSSSGRREFVDLPEDVVAGGPRIQVGRAAPRAGGPGIEKVSETSFNVSRAEVDKTLSDFNRVLTEARAVPNFENGVANGYKLFQIVPGSIYDKLGLQNGDVISGLNGEPINDPAKAMSMLSELKTSNHLELQVKKNGKVQTYSYDIR